MVPLLLIGIGAEPTIVDGSFRSLLGFWMGGLGSEASGPVPPPTRTVGWVRRRRYTRQEFDELLEEQRKNTFSRKLFDELWDAEQHARERASVLKNEKAAEALRQASSELVEVAGAIADSNPSKADYWIGDLAKSLERAATVSRAFEIERLARDVVRAAKRIQREIELLDEEEALMLLAN